MTEVPAVVLAGLSESQQRLVRLADNKLALNASWNLDLLTAELKELRAEGVDLAVTGFDADELAELFGPMDEGVLDTEPELPPAVPYTRRGDLWLLGPHRLLCGNATETAAWTGSSTAAASTASGETAWLSRWPRTRNVAREPLPPSLRRRRGRLEELVPGERDCIAVHHGAPGNLAIRDRD
jgi:hypothetical protein